MPHDIRAIAAKEYQDAITSRRFLIVLAILIILSTLGFLNGLNYYCEYIDSYKSAIGSPEYQELADQIRQQIAVAEASNAPAGEINALKSQLATMINPVMPSAMMMFDGLSANLTFVGMVLAIAIGFDMVSKEIEEGSLKMLLSHPVHRDSIILGKIAGSILLLLTVLLIVYAILLAALLLYGIVPGPDDIGRIAVSLFISLLYLTVFLSIAIATSALTRNSSTSILFAIGIALMTTAIPVLTGYVVGPNGGYTAGSDGYGLNNSLRLTINDILTKITPLDNFGSMSQIVFLDTTMGGPGSFRPILQVLPFLASNAIVFLSEIALVLFVAYRQFISIDVR